MFELEAAFRNFRKTQHWQDWSCHSAGKSLYPSNVTLELLDELRINHGLHPALEARCISRTRADARFDELRGPV